MVERAHTLGALAVLEAPLDGQELVALVRRAERLAASARTGFAGRTHDPLTGLDTGAGMEKKLDRLVGSGAGVIFKGSGFYETDYKRSSTPPPSESDSSSSSSDSKKSDDTSSSKDD